NGAKRGRELANDPVQRRLAHPDPSPRISSRISASGTIGTNRSMMKNNVRKRPIEPAKVAQSHRVGVKLPHSDGMWLRWRLVTTMTKRSHHMPMIMAIEIIDSIASLTRIAGHHRSCGNAMLSTI